LPYETFGNSGDTVIDIEASNADDLFANNFYEEDDMDDYIFMVKCVICLLCFNLSYSNTSICHRKAWKTVIVGITWL